MACTELTRAHYERRCARYASDLTDAEWAPIAPVMPSANRIGRPRKTDLREVVNALYLASSGGAWRLLPKNFPAFSTVQKYFYRWREEGLLRTISNSLVMAAREAEGREASPTAGVIGQDHGERRNPGLRRGKEDQRAQASHRCRHHRPDGRSRRPRRRYPGPGRCTAALKTILQRWPWLRHVFADGGYPGPKLKGAMQKTGTFTLEFVKRTDKAKGFEVLPRRWVVERTFAWLG